MEGMKRGLRRAASSAFLAADMEREGLGGIYCFENAGEGSGRGASLGPRRRVHSRAVGFSAPELRTEPWRMSCGFQVARQSY